MSVDDCTPSNSSNSVILAKQALLIFHEICYNIVDVYSIFGVPVCELLSIWVYNDCWYGVVEPQSSAFYMCVQKLLFYSSPVAIVR